MSQSLALCLFDGRFSATRSPIVMTWTAMVFGLIVAAVGGCSADPTKGYSFESSFDRSVTAVHVPMFQNDTFAKGVEFEVTDAVVKEIQRTTPWRVTSEGAADAVLEGRVTRATLRRLSQQRDSGVVQEQAVNVTVDFTLRDVRTGKTIVGRRNVQTTDVFVPVQPVGERLEVGENAVVQRLAKDLVNELRSNW
ncbi:MAG: LptE family protein [Phycisphaeraceae bacterium]|nr:LptE family protein [Phycisphaeraceae bacterium]